MYDFDAIIVANVIALVSLRLKFRYPWGLYNMIKGCEVLMWVILVLTGICQIL